MTNLTKSVQNCGIHDTCENQYLESLPVQQSQWISVEDRLPNKSINNAGGVTDYILVSVSCENKVKFTTVDRYDPYTKSWVLHLGSKDGRNVTHWMPLPEPQTEKMEHVCQI